MLGLARYHGENYLCVDMIAPICCIVVQVDCEMLLYFTAVFVHTVPWCSKESGNNFLIAMNVTVPKRMGVACVGMRTVSD